MGSSERARPDFRPDNATHKHTHTHTQRTAVAKKIVERQKKNKQNGRRLERKKSYETATIPSGDIHSVPLPETKKKKKDH